MENKGILSFIFFFHSSFMYYILTSVFPSSISLSPYPHLPSSPDPLLLHLSSNKRTLLPGIPTECGLTSYNKTSHKLSYQDWMKHPSRRKRVPSSGKTNIDFISLWFLAYLSHGRVKVGTTFTMYRLTILLQYFADLELSVSHVCLHRLEPIASVTLVVHVEDTGSISGRTIQNSKLFPQKNSAEYYLQRLHYLMNYISRSPAPQLT